MNLADSVNGSLVDFFSVPVKPSLGNQFTKELWRATDCGEVQCLIRPDRRPVMVDIDFPVGDNEMTFVEKKSDTY